MLKIELQEHDGVLKADGIPSLVVISVNGVRFPYQTIHSIQQLYADIGRMKNGKSVGASVFHEHVDHLAVAEPEPVEELAEQPAEKKSSIYRGDVVEYIGKSDDSGDLVQHELYDVISADGLKVDIINNKADSPMRMTVLRSDLVLHKKGKRVQKRIDVKERGTNCPLCQTEAVLTKQSDGSYHGECVKCHTKLEEVAA